MEQKTSKVRIGRSPVGRGVFARQRFRRTQIVGEIHGKIIHDPAYGSCYCIDLGHGRLLEPRSPFRYLNHSCDPNCEVFSWEVDELTPAEMLWISALRTIYRGEELTIDYGWPAEAAIPCGCGSVLCRGWIVCQEELPLLLNSPLESPCSPPIATTF